MDVSKRKVERLGSNNSRNREAPVGILRLEAGKSRRSSSEFKTYIKEPASPQPSILSVTFADESNNSPRYLTSPNQLTMDKVQFSPSTTTADVIDHSDDDEYSASVTAIMQRRASTKKTKRRNSRRTSSPFSPDILPGSDNGRRRSSVYTTSSGDTAITMDESLLPPSQDQIYENIRLHKEVLANVRMQPWNMRKKLRLVNQAKNYIKKHQGALQERLAQSRSTKDILARWNLIFVQKLQYIKRESANLSTWFTPWELRIKEIESHFGSVVASYFIFLRWLFWVNLVISSIIVAFVTVPELLTADPNAAGDRKGILKEDKYNATNFLTLWDFEGVLKYSPLFYGWYTNRDRIEKGYRLPFAYFMTGLAVYTYSFVATLRKMAENSRLSKLSEKDDECVFSWKLFTGWDYMIGNPETAHNRVASIVMSFKEALLEEAEKKKERRNWKIIGLRILVNLIVIGLLVLSAYAVVEVVRRSAEPDAKSTLWRANEVTVVMTLISMIFPMLFEVLGLLEQYHPRKQLRIQLARIMVLNLLNLYSLIFALFDKINDMTIELQTFKRIGTPIPEDTLISSSANPYVTSQFYSSTEPYYNSTYCYEICTTSTTPLFNLTTSPDDFYGNSLWSNLTTILPNVFEILNVTDYDTNFTTNFATTLMNYFANYTTENSTDFYDATQSSYEDLFAQMFANIMGNDTTIDSYDLKDNKLWNVTEYYENETSLNLAIDDFRANSGNLIKKIYEHITSTLSDTQDIFNSSFEETTTSTRRIEEIESNGEENCEIICESVPTDYPSTTTLGNDFVIVAEEKASLNYSSQSRLRSLCWETMFGQELLKLTVMDLVMVVASTLGMDFLRGLFVRYFNRCWCWDLEKKFPQYGDFKVAENILHLVNNQGNVWMGMFFSPGIAVINVIKLYAIMYFRSWTVLTCNVPHEVIFRASRSNNFYFALLLLMLFLCVLPVGYAIVWLPPSWHCGPFSNYRRIFHIFTLMLKKVTPKRFEKALDYIASPATIIPLLVLLTLIIYYLVSLTNALREANSDLKLQLRRERTEERRKMFQIADRRRRVGSEGSSETQNPFSKWKKLLQTLPDGKSLDETPRDSEPLDQRDDKIDPDKKAFLSKFIRRAIRKSSTVDDEEYNTDNEQNESLPDDVNIRDDKKQEVAMKIKPKVSSFKHAINTTIAQKRNNNIKTDVNEVKHVKINEIATPHTIKKSQPLKKDSNNSIKKIVKSDIENIPKKETNTVENDANFSGKNGVSTEKDGVSTEKDASFTETEANFSGKDVDVIRTVVDDNNKDEVIKKDFENRQDSLASNWSDNIPVITISKTESEECILEKTKIEKIDETDKIITTDKSNDEIDGDLKLISSKKYVLKKQTSEIESDVDNDDDDFDEVTAIKQTISNENKSNSTCTSGTGSAQTSSETNKTESSCEYKEDYKFS